MELEILFGEISVTLQFIFYVESLMLFINFQNKFFPNS